MSTIIEIIPVYAVNLEENNEIKSNEEVEYSEAYKEYLINGKNLNEYFIAINNNK